MNPKTSFFFEENGKWQQAYALLRELVLQTELQEELKWGVPCYTYQGNNVVLIHGFKDYCALLFHKGSLLNDPNRLLIQQTKNVQAGRQMRFRSELEIIEHRSQIQYFLNEAIRIEKAGKKIAFKKTEAFEMPEEFKRHLSQNNALKKAFEQLTPGRQRGYLLFFVSAKLAATREARIVKHIPDILSGKGLNDITK